MEVILVHMDMVLMIMVIHMDMVLMSMVILIKVIHMDMTINMATAQAIATLIIKQKILTKIIHTIIIIMNKKINFLIEKMNMVKQDIFNLLLVAQQTNLLVLYKLIKMD
jgi:hypothetical protein